MTRLKRRQLLGAAGAYAGFLAGATGRAEAAKRPSQLVRDPNGVLDLPPGFSYRVISRAGRTMDDGYRVPGKPDAMGIFEVGEHLVLMRNHEVSPGDRSHGPYSLGTTVPKQAYDPAAFGGVTRLILDRQTLELKREELALCGTHWNCAGGLSPWGWLSCEELFIPRHGYVFLVSHTDRGLNPARPIRAYGRFRHEAACVDRRTGIAYLTEDREDAAFYRFVPDTPGRPFEGRLQALRIRDSAGFNTAALPLAERVAVDWIDVPEPDPAQDTVRAQARQRGAARFARTEGLWLGADALYMCATTGGPIGRGQILQLTYKSERPELSVIAHSDDPSVLDMPDNITVAPHGELYVAEDGPEGNWLRRISPAGVVNDFARNAHSPSEFSGPCFAPDGETLLVNIQHDGLTLAIRGPFGALSRETSSDHTVRQGKASLHGFVGLGAGALVITLGALMHRRRSKL